MSKKMDKLIPVKFTYPANVYVSDEDHLKFLNGDFQVGDTLFYREYVNGEIFKAVVVQTSWKPLLEKM